MAVISQCETSIRLSNSSMFGAHATWIIEKDDETSTWKTRRINGSYNFACNIQKLTFNVFNNFRPVEIFNCHYQYNMVMAQESQHKESNARSTGSLTADEEIMRPGHRLGLVLCVPFSTFTRMVEWQEGHPAHQKPCSTKAQKFSSRNGEGGPKSNRMTRLTWKTGQ